MGGYGSTRWSMVVTRVSTEGVLRLDVRSLARDGCLLPGTSATITWSEGASITTEVGSDAPSVIILEYCVSTDGRLWLQVRNQIPLTTTPCIFGGVRDWFACPGCGGRCAILYALKGHFQCRACNRLAYASTRDRCRPISFFVTVQSLG